MNIDDKGLQGLLESQRICRHVADEAEKLLHSLGEMMRQTMQANPEWSEGVQGLHEALIEYRRYFPAEEPKVAYQERPRCKGPVTGGGCDMLEGHGGRCNVQ